ncbi:MAG: hypothetical protein ACP5G1_03795 [Nanopusillaceae archaeon]
MSDQSQTKLTELDVLHGLLKFLYCLVPCYTEKDNKDGTTKKKRYYALVSYCSEKFSVDSHDDDHIFVNHNFNGKPTYLHKYTVNSIREGCKECKFCNIILESLNQDIWNKLNIEIIGKVNEHVNVNDENSYIKGNDGRDKMSIYQLDTQQIIPITSVNKICDNGKSIFIKNNLYIEDVNNTNQEVNLQYLEQLLLFKRQLLLRVINIILEQPPVDIDRQLLLRVINIILEQTSISINNDNIEAIVDKLINRIE